jgi:hypothetical protein
VSSPSSSLRCSYSAMILLSSKPLPDDTPEWYSSSLKDQLRKMSLSWSLLSFRSLIIAFTTFCEHCTILMTSRALTLPMADGVCCYFFFVVAVDRSSFAAASVIQNHSFFEGDSMKKDTRTSENVPLGAYRLAREILRVPLPSWTIF